MKPDQRIAPGNLQRARDQVHPHCVVCNPANSAGLRTEFTVQADNSVVGEFPGSAVFEGYPGLLHGGVSAALLDGAMTNCLFAHGIEAFTAELTVRYREPVDTRGNITVRASLAESHGRLHLLRAELRQGGRIKATARGKFIEKNE
jgi:acyl-coenzyme A thioesterase PaaI-like protein